ncbi:MAG TPA: sulfite exporter TauE/SafE family protein [Candidatus Saccharimonadales bacterium]|jgi:hypothetical protein
MDVTPLLTLLIAFISSILSGMAGVGGGFIMAPYWLLIGLTPAQAATTGSFMALGMGLSSLAAFKNTGHFPKNKNLIVVLLTVTIIASVIGATILPNVNPESFKSILAIITIISLPLLFVKKSGKKLNKKHQFVGLVLFSLFVLAGSIVFSSAFSILMAIVLTSFFSLTILQSTALRRLISTVQVLVLFSLLAYSGNFVAPHAFMGITGGILGSYLGTKYALRKGETFAKIALVIGALISSMALLF